MPDIGSPPKVIVRQVFEEPLGVKIIPRLPACIIGEHFQIETKLLAGTYAGVAKNFDYPDKVVGAEIVVASVKVELETPEDIFDITAFPGVVIDATDVSLPNAVTPEKDLTSPRQVSTVAGNQLIDPNGLFIASSIRPGDIVRFDTAAPLAFVDSNVSAQVGDFTVLQVIDENTLQVTPVLINENKVEYKIVRKGTASGSVFIGYRAQRFDLVEQLLFLQGVEEGERELGVLDNENNPLGLAFAIASQNTALAVAVTAVRADTPLEHQRASEFLEGKTVYGIVPLSQNELVIQLWQQHVNQQSDPEIGFNRVVLINPVVEDFEIFQASRTAIAPTGPAFPDTTFADAGALFLTNAVPVGAVLRITAVTGVNLTIDGVVRALPFELQIASIQSNTQVTTLGAFTADPGNVTYEVRTLAFTKSQKAANMRDIAKSFADRRVWMIFPDEVKSFVGASEKVIPGYFAAAAYAGLRSQVVASQPLSNAPLAGFSGLVGSNEFFSPSQLSTIQTGGVAILIQRVEGAPILIRRQLTTDVSSEVKAEQTGTVVPDFMTFFLQAGLEPLVGRHVITPEFLQHQVRPGVNGLIRSAIEERVIGSKTRLLSVEKSETARTTVLISVDLEVLDPANFFDITLRIR